VVVSTSIEKAKTKTKTPSPLSASSRGEALRCVQWRAGHTRQNSIQECRPACKAAARDTASHSFSTSARGSEFEDQFRTCREHAGREGWQVIDIYQDAVISGASVILRPGIQLLLQNAQRGKFDIVLAEALDRISRDQADVATLFSICALPACESSRWPKAKSPNVMPASKAR
jgi:hypothetical protein